MPLSSAGACTSTTRWGVIWVGKLGHGLGEERAGDVDAGRTARDLTELEVLDEQRRDDVHGSEASEMAACLGCSS